MDSRSHPARRIPKQQGSGRDAGREERAGPAEDRAETQWVIEQIQQSFR